jgi:glutathione-specific gamma-glutamylcyclotransferase
VTRKSSDGATNPLGPSGPDGQLARADFTPERVAAYAHLAKQFGDAKLLSEEEREASRAKIMAEHPPGGELWIFGYGSLMWNPAVHVDQSLPATIEGFRRSFCMRLMFGRAMPDNPGLMLCLIPGGTCAGIAHRIAPENVESESRILWMREMLSGAYIPMWVDIDLGARRVRGITFAMNTAHPRYQPDLPHDAQAERIAKAEGHLGTSRDYLFRTVAALEGAGLKDYYLDDIHARVRALIEPKQGASS